MYAAVVTSFDAPPRYREWPEPVAHGGDEVVVEVLAAGLHPRVRSQADGSHYTSTQEHPLIPGIDAVVRDPQGRIRYTVLDDTTLGTMAQRTVIELHFFDEFPYEEIARRLSDRYSGVVTHCEFSIPVNGADDRDRLRDLAKTIQGQSLDRARKAIVGA